jgi:hypothetical protein
MLIASFIRCRSPPDRVVSGCPRLRYPRPTELSRSRIVRDDPWPKNSRASVTVIRSTSLMFFPRSCNASTSGVKRAPLHCSHTDDTSAIIPRSV